MTTDYKDHYQALLIRDKWICGICSKKIKDYWQLSIDHILARMNGGTNDIENLQLAHKECNRLKFIKVDKKLKNKNGGKLAR